MMLSSAIGGIQAPPLLFISGGPWEYVIILLVVLLLFGSKLPKMARSLGESFIEFKKGVKGDDGKAIAKKGDDQPAAEEGAKDGVPAASPSDR